MSLWQTTNNCHQSIFQMLDSNRKECILNSPLELGRIPYQVVDIRDGFFCGFKVMKREVLAIRIEQIGESVFEKWTNLEQINFLPNLKDITKMVFYGLKFPLPPEIKRRRRNLRWGLFFGCYYLKEFILQSSFTQIIKRTFTGAA